MLVVSGQFTRKDLGKAVAQVMQTAPIKAGEIVVRFANQRFAEESWVDGRTETWPRRKSNAKRNQGRRLLVDTGRLRRSIRILHTMSMSVAVGTDVPYAGVHNDGFRGTVQVKAHTRRKFTKSQETFTTRTGRERKRTVLSVGGSGEVRAHSRRMNMPRRRYLGESKEQSAQIQRMLLVEINKALR
jgi:phage gpG-like protein